MSYNKFVIIKKSKIKKDGLEVKNLKEVIKDLKKEGYYILSNDFNIKED